MTEHARPSGLARIISRAVTAAGPGAVLAVASADPASAHVKWFCAFDVAGRPRGLEQVLCGDFEMLSILAVFGLTLGAVLECSRIGPHLLTALDRATAAVRADTPRLIRIAVGFYLVSVWNIGGIILTPELKTDAAWISWLQLAMAAMLVWKRTLPLTALGLIFLFGMATWQYGAFHLADYPIFLGLAAALALIGLDRDVFGIRPTDVLRYALAITMMWASIEKWAYPQWTEPLIAANPMMTMGVGSDLFMRAAGVVEFSLAFALIWTPLVCRIAAIALGIIFVAAIPEFGKIDAIGHSCIVTALLVIAADDARAPAPRWGVALIPAAYGVALGSFITLYYAGHAALYRALPSL